MRFLVMIVLLVLMPMQLTWAALSVYCPHETGSSAPQIKNHEHQHQTAANLDDGGDPHATGSADADAGACHAGHITALFGSGHLLAVSVSSETYTAHQIQVPSPPLLSLPERPNWAALA
jgi:hypothetical protein